MKTLGTHNYYVYILTNYNKTVLYVGITNDLKMRMYHHKNPTTEDKLHFITKYKWKSFKLSVVKTACLFLCCET